MKITPRTEKELAERNLWPAGKYTFEVNEHIAFGQKTFSTEEKKSSKGDDMIVLAMLVYNEEGEARPFLDYLVNIESVEFKIRHAAEACGILDKYNAGELTADDFIGKTGELKLRVGKATEKYPTPRNEVGDYVVVRSEGGGAPPSSAIPPPGHPAAEPMPWEG